ncbi:MAG: putative hydroxymethylpyrimidine transporter CytX [Asticcacaulis sp.]
MTDISDQKAYDPLTPVPTAKRTLTLRDAFSLWFSLGIGLLVLEAGSYLVPGLSLPEALLAVVIGSVAGAILLALAGVVGADTGLASNAALRPTLGVRGAAIAAVLNVIQLVGWGAFEIIAMRDAANTLSANTFNITLPVVWTLLFGAAATGLAIMGPLGFIRRFLRHYGLWLLLAGAAWMTWALLADHNLTAILARKGEGGLSLGGGIDIVIAMPLSWLPLIADYARFGTSPKAVFRGSALGYMLANIWFFGLGAAYALIAANDPQGMLLSALAVTGGGLALLLILLDETDNVFADIFSAATSTGTLINLPIRYLAIGFGVLCTVIALFVPMTRFVDFLIMIGSVFTPLYGVMLVDHFIIRKRRIVAADIRNLKGVYGFTGGLHIRAIIAWISGIVTYYGCLHYLPAMGATLPAFCVAALGYWGLANLWPRSKDT